MYSENLKSMEKHQTMLEVCVEPRRSQKMNSKSQSKAIFTERISAAVNDSSKLKKSEAASVSASSLRRLEHFHLLYEQAIRTIEIQRLLIVKLWYRFVGPS